MKILKQNWKTFAQDNNGEFKTISTKSLANFSDPVLKKFELKIPFLDGQIVFFTTEFKPLKISFEFRNKIKNEFLIYPEDFTDKIGKLLGLKELETEDKVFDRKFFIKADNKNLILQILTPKLRKFLVNNLVSNFKLNRTSVLPNIKLNIVINELKYSEMDKLLRLFQESIMIVKRVNNIPIKPNC